MKSLYSIFLLLLVVFAHFHALKVNAQNHLISFAGTGESTTVETVEVENLNSGASLKLNGSDILRLTDPTDLTAVEEKNNSLLFRIYPNPMIDQSILEFVPPAKGEAMISVIDITGRPVDQIYSYLETGSQEFRLSGLKKGLYLVSVTGTSYQFSKKMISMGSSEGILKIEKIASNQRSANGTLIEKKAGISPTIIDMPYVSGDRLKFVVRSGIYTTIQTDIPTRDKVLTFNFVKCVDGDNNNYPIIEIGNQIWMAENLKTTKYNDGTSIPLITDNCEWKNLKTPGVCWYNYDEASNKASYGALYNWYAADTSELCPTDWHVPTDEEWKTLERFLGMTWESSNKSGFRGTDQGSQLKSTTGWQCGGNGSNSSGFSGLPSGARWLDTGKFQGLGTFAGWWSSSEIFGDGALIRYLYYYYNSVNRMAEYSSHMGKQNGFSVRCLKDKNGLR